MTTEESRWWEEILRCAQNDRGRLRVSGGDDVSPFEKGGIRGI
jgi:hypothetical protein